MNELGKQKWLYFSKSLPNRWLKILSKVTSPIFSRYFWVTLLTLFMIQQGKKICVNKNVTD